MNDSNVLVIFYSRGGLTERLAVLLAEGAIQGGANIRLRRCRDVMPEELIAADTAWEANRTRMHEEFAAPRLQDLEWADVIAFGTPAAPAATGPELATTLAHIGLGIASEVLRGKGATAFTSSYGARQAEAGQAGAGQAGDVAVHDLQSRLLQLGFTVLPRPESLAKQEGVDDTTFEYETARVQGRLAASLARRLRGWRDQPAT